MNIQTMLAPRGSAARPGYLLVPRYITIHNTANTNKGAGSVSHGRYLSGTGAKKAVSYHYAVDDSAIVQIIPDSENAWHAGDGANGKGIRQSLAIEICENPESDLRRATDNAAELTAHLMREWDIPLSNVVQHNHWSGKDCPRRLRIGEPYSWDTFLAQVQTFYDGTAPAQGTQDAPGTTDGETSAPPAVGAQTDAQGATRRYLHLSRGDLIQLMRTADDLGLAVCADLTIGPASPGDDRALCALAQRLALTVEEVG